MTANDVKLARRGAWRLFLLTVVILTLIFAGLAWLAWQERQTALQVHLDKQSELQRMALLGLRDDTEELAMLSANMLASDPEIARLVRQAARDYARNRAQGGSDMRVSETVELGRSRQQLRRQLDSRWHALQQQGVSQVNVHLGPDALTLARVGRPLEFGERATGALGASALSEGELVTGIDIAQHRLAMRAVSPVQAEDGGSVVGVVGVGVDLFASLQRLEERISQRMEASETGMALLVNRDNANGLHDDQRQSLEVASTHWLARAGVDERMRQWLATEQVPAPGDEARHLSLAQEGQDFLLTLLPLNDVASLGETPSALALAVWSNITNVLEASQRQDTRIGLLWGGAWLVTLVCVLSLFSLMRRRDARQARRHHRDLEESRQKLQALYALSPLAIVLNRMSDGQFLDANQALSNLTGYTLDELKELSYWDLTPESYADDEARQLERLRIEGQYGPYEKEYFHRDGHRVPVLLNGVRFEDVHGEAMIWSIIQDMSEYKRIQTMKDEFISTVSHELRTPLTSISGSLDLILGGALGEVPATMKEMLTIAQRNSQRLTHLINDLLDVEKLASGKMHLQLSDHRLRALLEEALENHQGYARQFDVGMQLEGRGDATVEVDALRFGQVMANLLSNAIKFSPPGSRVTVTYTLADEAVHVGVIDRGKGIPAAFRERVFQRFSQADSSDSRTQGGSGLGLVICKQLVEQMHGSIGFETRDNEGTTFRFSLPKRDESDGFPASDQEAGGDVGSLTPRVLIVEDDADASRLLGVMLDHAGYRYDRAASLTEARQCLTARPYDAVTLDLGLPDGNGIELLRELRRAPETQNLPVLVISASCDEGRLQIQGSVTEVGWLAKPVNERSLIETLSSQLEPKVDSTLPRVLHVEDDADLIRVVATIGKRLAHFDAATSLSQARQCLSEHDYDLILLDLGLPDGNGLALCETLRLRGKPVPVVVMSAQELPPEQHRRVTAVLSKSRTSSEQLLDVLQRVLPEAHQ